MANSKNKRLLDKTNLVYKNKRLWVMAGIPGSGKSTFIQNHKSYFNEHQAIISRDDIRFSFVTENDAYFSKEIAVFNEFIRQIKNSLNENVDTIVDATHISIGSRAKLLRHLAPALKEVEINAIVLKVPLEVALERNSHREGLKFVPETAIENMYHQFTEPTFEEGFDNIWIKDNEEKMKVKTKEVI